MYAKFGDIFSNIWGWVVSGILMLFDVFAGHGFLIAMIVILTCIDAVWGVAVSIKKKKFAQSELLRLTIGKLAVYGCAMFGFLAIDHYIRLETGLEIGVTSGLVGLLISLTELWSSSASMLIIYPDFPILKMLQKQLTGEIARKLGCEEKEVAKILKPQPRAKNGQFVQRKKK